MNRPPEGLCLKAELVRVRDGDTIEVRVLGGGYTWAVRLIDCWAPETHTAAGRESKEYAEKLMATFKDGLYVYIPAPHNLGNLLKNITFDRIPGYVFVSYRQTMNDLMVRAGHASATKEGQKK